MSTVSSRAPAAKKRRQVSQPPARTSRTLPTFRLCGEQRTGSLRKLAPNPVSYRQTLNGLILWKKTVIICNSQKGVRVICPSPGSGATRLPQGMKQARPQDRGTVDRRR